MSDFGVFIFVVCIVLQIIILYNVSSLIYEKNRADSEKKKILEDLSKTEKSIEEKEAILLEQKQNNPVFVELISKYEKAIDELKLEESQKRDCWTRDIVKKRVEEKELVMRERNELSAQICVYEHLFPWLVEFKKLSVNQAVFYAKKLVESPENYKNWIYLTRLKEDTFKLIEEEKANIELEKNKLQEQYSALNILSNKIEANRNTFAHAEEIAHKLMDYHTADIFKDIDGVRLFVKAYESDFKSGFSITGPIEFNCNIHSGNRHYKTSLKSCDCESYKFGKGKPCKHMIFLAMTLGFISLNQEQYATSLDYLSILSRKLLSKETEIKKTEKKISEKQIKLESQKEAIDNAQNILNDSIQNHPGFATLLQRYNDELDRYRISELEARHAKKSADIVKEIKKEKKEILLERDLLFAQLAVYEDLFPWLAEFKEVPIEQAVEYVRNFDGDSEYYKKWLSPEEYSRLSQTERLQLALDRWKKRPKTDWEVGIEYERYIGYLCEKEGYKVEYFGALNGKQDMGRDLVLTKKGKAVIIQCKRWSKDKQIHEKHIFQLFGTSILYKLDNIGTVSCAIITTAELSETAKKCAELLDVNVIYKDLSNYPLIKCNINRATEEKIYHLPFDQQYDRVEIEREKGEEYVYTVQEAEKRGYRHAFKHF